MGAYPATGLQRPRIMPFQEQKSIHAVCGSRGWRGARMPMFDVTPFAEYRIREPSPGAGRYEFPIVRVDTLEFQGAVSERFL